MPVIDFQEEPETKTIDFQPIDFQEEAAVTTSRLDLNIITPISFDPSLLQNKDIDIERAKIAIIDAKTISAISGIPFKTSDAYKHRETIDAKIEEDSWWKILSGEIYNIYPAFGVGLGGNIRLAEEGLAGGDIGAEMRSIIREQELKRASGELPPLTEEYVGPKPYEPYIGEQIAERYSEILKKQQPNVAPQSLKYYAHLIVLNTFANLPALGVGIATKGRAAPLTMMGIQAGGTKYQQLREGNIPIGESAKGAVITGVSEAATEFLPMDALIKEGVPFAKRLLLASGLDIPGELINTSIESAIDKVTITPNMTLKNYAAALIETAIVSLGSAGLLTTTAHPLVWSRDFQKRVEDGRKKLSQQNLEVVLSEEEKKLTAEFSPETLRESKEFKPEQPPSDDAVIEAAAGEITDEELDSIIEKNMPMDEEVIPAAEASPSAATPQEAVATSPPQPLPSIEFKDTAIVQGKRMSQLMGPSDNIIIAHSPEGKKLGYIWYTREPDGGFTVRKTEVFEKRKGIATALTNEAVAREGINKGFTDVTPEGLAFFKAYAEKYPENVSPELRQRLTELTAEREAEFKLAPTEMPEEKAKPAVQEGLIKVQPEMPKTAIAIEEAGHPMLEEITKREEEKRQLAIPEQPAKIIKERKPVRPNPESDSLAAYVRKQGGFNYQKEHMKGELDRLSKKEAGTTGLISKSGKGYTLDQMLEKAIEDGYFNENATINDLLDALENEVYMKKEHYSTMKVWSDKELGEMMIAGMILESKKDYGKILTDNHKEYANDKENLAIAEKAIKSTRQLELYSLPETQRDVLDERSGKPLEKGGIKTHAIGITPELTRKGYINLQGQEVKTPKQVAILAQVFRNPQYETLRIIYAKDNKVIGHEGITSNLPGAISIFTAKDYRKEIYEFKDRLKRLGADSVWLVHNHPSGNALPSVNDLNMTAKFSQILPVKGHIVIDSQEYSFIPADGSEGTVHPLKTDDSILKPSLSHELIGTRSESPDMITKLAAKIKTGDYITALYVSSNLNVRGIQEIPYGMLKDPKALTDYLRGRAREFGAPLVQLAGKQLEGMNKTDMKTLIKNGVILDYVVFDDVSISLSYRDTIASGEPPAGWLGSVVKKYNVAEETKKYGEQEAMFPETKPPVEFKRDVVDLREAFREAAIALREARKLKDAVSEQKAKRRMKWILNKEVQNKAEILAKERFEELDKGDIDLSAHLLAHKKGEYWNEFKRGVDKTIGIISTRLKNIHPTIKDTARKYVWNVEKRIAADEILAYDFIEGFNKLKDDVKVELSHALLDGNKEKADRIASKYGLLDSINKIRNMLPQIRQRAIAAGFEIGEIENYWPRVVKDPESLLAELRGWKEWSAIDEAIRKAEQKEGRALSIDEKAQIADMLLRGYPQDRISITLPKSSALKQRKLEKIPRQLLGYYMPADQSLISHIKGMNNTIEAANFFGKFRKERGVNEKLNLDLFNDTIIEKSIGNYIIELKEKGFLKREDEKALRGMLQAIFKPAKVGSLVKAYKNLTYLQLLVQIGPQITQLGDIALVAEKAGYFRTLKAAGKAIIGKSDVTLQDINVTKILEEFDGGQDALARYLNKGLRLTGFSAFDRLGKLTLINAKFEQLQKQARKQDKILMSKLERIFESKDDANKVMKELAAGKKTDNTLFLLYNALSNAQPISKLEVPEKYLTSNYGKTFYALKTYQLKLLDVYRNDIWHEIKNGNKLYGFKKLITLTTALVLLGTGADEIKDFILGRKSDFNDRFWDNLFRLFGFSKYTMYKVRKEGLSRGLLAQFAPPAGVIDPLTKDIDELIRKGELEKGTRTIGNIPGVGKAYYWWFGYGRKQKKKKQKK